MATIESLYGTNGVTITITLTSLADSATAFRESTPVDNSSNLYLDALVQVKIKLAASGTIGNDKKVYVYAAGSVDGGTTWPDNATGADATTTFTNPTNLKLIGVIDCTAYVTSTQQQFISEPFSVAAAFGGILPKKWSVVIQNRTNIAFTSTSTDHVVQYQGIQAQTM